MKFKFHTSVALAAVIAFTGAAPAFAQAAQKIDAAIDAAIKDPASRTRDLGGTLGTQAFAANVAARLG